jgi:hypothetical protein
MPVPALVFIPEHLLVSDCLRKGIFLFSAGTAEAEA